MKKQILLYVLMLTTALTIAAKPKQSMSGLVLDQDNNPVAGATVHAVMKIQGASAGENKLLTTQTDQNGNFVFSFTDGDIKITSIKKAGYICTKNQLGKVNSVAAEQSLASSTSGSLPILVKMHKKAIQPAFLHTAASQFRIKSKGAGHIYLDMQNGRDLTQAVMKNIEKKKASKLNNTLQIQNAFNPATQQYQLTLTCLQKDTGIIVSDELLYEAPAEGYTSQATLNIPYSKTKLLQSTAYFYLKSAGKKKDQAVYSGMTLDITAGKAELIAEAQVLTNPSGGRNLEYDEKYQQKYIAERLQMINSAVKDKTATEQQVQEMHELLAMQQAGQRINRWDFDGTRRRQMQQQREKELDATGRTRPKIRTINRN